MVMNAMIALLNVSIGARSVGPSQAPVSAQGAMLGGGGKAQASAPKGEFAGILNAAMAGGAQTAVAGANVAAAGASTKPAESDQTDAINYIHASLMGGVTVPAQVQAVPADAQAIAALNADGTPVAQVQPAPAVEQAQVAVTSAPQAEQAQVAVTTAPAVMQTATDVVAEGLIPTVARSLANIQSAKDSGVVNSDAKTQPASTGTEITPNAQKSEGPLVSADLMASLNAFGGGKDNPFIKNPGNHISGKGVTDSKAVTSAVAGKPGDGDVQSQAVVAAKPAVAGGADSKQSSPKQSSIEAGAALTGAVSNSADDDDGQSQGGRGFSGIGPNTQTMSETVVKAQVASSMPTNLSKVIQVNDQTFSVVRRGDHALEITLQPEGLGKLNLEVSVSKGVVTAHINAPDQASKDVIERNLQGILEELQKEGLDMGGFSVDVRKGTDEQVADQKKNGQQENRPSAQEDEALALASAAQSNRSMNPDRLVSVYA